MVHSLIHTCAFQSFLFYIRNLLPKGYSYDAYNSNEVAKEAFAVDGKYDAPMGRAYNRDRVHPKTMNEIGFEGTFLVGAIHPVMLIVNYLFIQL